MTLILLIALNKYRTISRPTHIHIHDAHAHTLAILSAVFFNNKINIVLSRRVDFPVKKNWMSRFKYNHKLVKKIVCVSDEIKRITAVSIQDKRKLCTVYSGVDLTKFSTTKGTVLRKEFGIADDVKIIGNTSAIADHKDYFTFVDAAKQILNSNNGVVFLIIGDGPDKEKIQAYVKKQQLDKKILFTGFRQDVPAILPELAVFLMTSKTEGLGTSLLDAMACGVPIVTTDAGGIPEIVIAQENGLLCSVGNAEQLAGNTINILENEALRTQLIEGGLKKVQQFSKEVTAEKTFEVYKEVVAS